MENSSPLEWGPQTECPLTWTEFSPYERHVSCKAKYFETGPSAIGASPFNLAGPPHIQSFLDVSYTNSHNVVSIQ